MMRKNKDTDIAPKTNEGLSLRGGPSDPFAWFGDMDRWFEEMRRDFDRAWTSWPGTLASPFAGLDGPRAPALDVRDTGAELVVTAEVPGVPKENLEIEATPDALEIKAEAQGQREGTKDGYVYRERNYSGFHRMLTLPADVAPDKATAKMENGVLEIHLPKQEPTPARTAVKVKVQ